jgi:hypothetical protein
MTTLINYEGTLYLAPERILLVRYPEGDCDSIPWPFQRKKDAENLESALFDAREMGDVPSDTRFVKLPDGGTFHF